MIQQFPQGNFALLRHQRPILLKNLHLFQFRTQFVDLLVIIEVQDALFHGLHACHRGENLGTAGDPEDRVQIHWSSVGTNSSFARSVGADLLAILVNGYKHETGHARFLVARDRVERLLHGILCLLVDHVDSDCAEAECEMGFLGDMPNEEEKSDIDVFIGNVFVLGFVVDMCPCPPLQVLTEGSPAREALPEAGHNLRD